MSKSSKKAISMLLSLCMLVSVLIIPIPVQAEGEGTADITTMGPNSKYAIGQEVGVQVNDADLGTESVDITVTSTKKPEGVTITLHEDGPNSGIYTGTIMISSEANEHGQSNRIYAEVGDDITFSYNDDGVIINTSIGVADRVEEPTISVSESETDPEKMIVELTFNTEGDSIYYTTDGSEPSRSSLLYDDASKPVIDANQSLTIKAFAVADGWADSEIAVFEYNSPAGASGGGEPSEDRISTSGHPFHAIGETVRVSVSDAEATTDTITVKVTSTSDESGFEIIIPKIDNGYYAGEVLLTTADSDITAQPPQIKVVLGDNVRFDYENINQDDTKTSINTNITVAERAEAPTANLPSQTVETNTLLELTTTTSGADIYYTTDGKLPDRNSILYTSDTKPQIIAGQFIIVKAVAVKNEMADSTVSTYYYNDNTLQFKGQVYLPDGVTPTKNAGINISDEDYQFITGAEIDDDGYFRIRGLAPGKYKMHAYTPDILLIHSDWKDVEIGVTNQNINFELVTRQIWGSVKKPDNSDLNQDQYDIWVRKDGSNDFKLNVRADNGYYAAGGMESGKYYIRLIPRGDSVFSSSVETEFTVNPDLTVTDPIVNLSLTNPQITGSVVTPGDLTPVTDGNVDIFDQWGNRLFDVQIQSDGSYKIGGLPQGEYYLAANPARWKEEYEAYDPSEKTMIKITAAGVLESPIGPLVLRTYAPRLRNANYYIKGSNELTARIMNADAIKQGEGDTIRAVICLGGEEIEELDHYWLKDHDQSDATLVMDVFEYLDLDFGKYTLKLYHNNNLLDVDGSDDLWVVSGLETYPSVVEPDDYSGTVMKIDVNETNGSRQYPWVIGDLLTVKITVGNHWEIDEKTVNATINADKTLTITLPSDMPEGALADGWHDIAVYRGDDVLAVGRFDIGISEIFGIKAEEASNNIWIEGNFMSKYMDRPYIEINKNNEKIITSGEWYNSWGNMMFRLPGSLKAGEEYQLILYAKLGDNDHEVISLPNDGHFVPVPFLDIDGVPVISGNSAGDSIVIKKSDDEGFEWDDSDNISAVVIGPGAENYTATTGNGISVQEESITFTTKENDKRGFPWQEGIYTLRLFNADTGKSYGVTDFVVSNSSELLEITVKDSDGSPSGKGMIRISKGDDWSDTARVYPNGTFYYPVSMLKGDGDYEIYAEALLDSADVEGKADFSVNEGEASTLSILITLDKAQIRGVVKEGTKNATGGRVELNSREEGPDWERYETRINYDGSYKLAGIKDGNYNIMAFAGDGSQYLCSDNEEITITSDSTAEQELDLNLPQVKGLALDVNGNPLRGDKFEVRIWNLNPGRENQDGCYWRSEDGMYMLGGLEPGNYKVYIQPHSDPNLPYSKSFNEDFTINEDGTASRSEINIYLTQPKVVGTLYDNDTPGKQIFSQAVVDVFQGDWKDLRFVAFAPVNEEGKFYIGGLPEGNYYIRAALTDRNNAPGLSQSLTVPITIGPDTSTVSLYLRDTAPRIKYIEDYSIGNSELRVRIINVETMNDLDKLEAEIVDQNGVSLVPSIHLDGVWIDWNSWDYNKDEGTIVFNMDGIILEPGIYSLKLRYDSGSVFENDTPDDYGFQITYELWVDPYAVRPTEYTNKTLRLGVDMKEEDYPWEAEDTLNLVLKHADGTTDSLTYTVNSQNIITATLPGAGLTEGQYQLLVSKAGSLLAKGWLTIGNPVVFGADDTNDGSDSISINGENLVIYLNGDNELKVKDASNNPILTTSDIRFEWGRIIFMMGERRLAPGNYTVEWKHNGVPVAMQNNTLKVNNWLKPTPYYFIRNNTLSEGLELILIDGSTALWSIGDNLEVSLKHEGADDKYAVILTPLISANKLTVTLDRDINQSGPIVVDVIRKTTTGEGINKEFIASSHFDVVDKVQMKGRVMDSSGNGIPYAWVNVGGDGWGTGYEADANGYYAIYGLNPGEYSVRVSPPKGAKFIEAEEYKINIENEETQLDDKDFVLQSGLMISGTISLPEGEKASDDIYMKVGAWAQNDMENGEDDQWFGTEAVIYKDLDEADYSIIVPEDFSDFLLQVWGGGDNYINGATYYNDVGGSYMIAEAETLSMTGTDKTDIDITLIKGKSITGQIKLPGGMNATENVTVKVMVETRAGTEDPDDDIHCEREFVIEAGNNSYNYKIVVPAAEGYILHYEQYSGMKLADHAIYKTNTESTIYIDQAGPINAQADVSGKDITLLGAKYISGTVTLPNEVTVPGDGFNMRISASLNRDTENWDDDISFGNNFKITEGNQGDYTIKVPDITDKYVGEFWGDERADCIFYALYSASGPVYTVAEAAKLDVTGEDLEGINFNLQMGRKITGTVTLPANAPAGGIRIGVEAIADGDGEFINRTSVYSEIVIPEYTSSVDYTLIVPERSDYRVKYNIDDRKYPYLMREGFYYTGNESGMTFNYDIASTLDMTVGNNTGIDLNVSSAKHITGTITLPEAAPKDGWLDISASNDDNRFGTGVEIKQGDIEVDYSFQVPADSAEYYIEVHGGWWFDWVDYMFYKESGRAYSLYDATIVDMGDVEYELEGIDLTLEKGKTITGNIILPAGTVIPEDGYLFRVEAYKENIRDYPEDDISFSIKVLMESLVETYTLRVPAYDGFIVKYDSDPANSFMLQGYHNNGSMVYDYVDAQVFDLSEGKPNLTGIDLTVVESVSITGSVIFPYTAAEYKTMWILAVDDNGTDRRDDDKGYGTLVEAQAGSNSANYELRVPKNSTNPYFIELWGGSVFGCVDNLFYGGNDAADTVYSPAAAWRIDIDEDMLSGRNLTLVEGKNISVTVKLPEGLTAPEGGYEFSVVAMNSYDLEKESDDVSVAADIVIDEGQSQYTFEMNIPKLNGYRLVVVSKDDQFEEALYHSESGMTVNRHNAGTIDATAVGSPSFILQTALISQLTCTAEVKDDGSAILLKLNKPFDGAIGLNNEEVCNAFKVTLTDAVGPTQYEINDVTYDDSTMTLTLDLKDYLIYKDYRNIKVSYTGNMIKSYDGKTMATFSDKAVVNNSTKEFSISGVADGGWYNRDVKLVVKSTGDEITITVDSTPTVETDTNSLDVNVLEGYVENVDVTIEVPGRRFVDGKMELSFTIDKQAPVVTITDVPESPLENDHNGVTPTITFTGDVDNYRAITLNGRAYKSDTVIKEAGVYTITASTKDAAGNIGKFSKTFEIIWDTAAPVITIDGASDGSIYDESVTPVITLSGGTNVDNYTYTAKLTKPDGSVVTNISGVAINDEGDYRLEVQAVNPSYTDIFNSKVIEFTIDKAEPTVSITNVPEGDEGVTPIVNTTVTPVITFTDTVASQQILTAKAVITLTRGSDPVEGYKRGDTITADGSYTLTVKTVDECGHESNLATKSFAIDRTKPVITITGAVNGNTYKDQIITITADKSEGTMTSVVKENGQVIDWSGEAFEGEAGDIVTYDLEFTAVDEAGNETVQTLSFTIDRLLVNISISGVTEGMLTNTDPFISFTVFEGEEEKQGATAKIDGAAFTGGRYSAAGNHTITVTYISGDNTYTKSITFKLDKTAPQITAGEVMKNVTPAQADIYVKSGDIVKVTANITDINGIGEVWLSIGSAAAKVPMKKAETGNVYEGSFTVESGNYDNQTLTVSAKDKAGNIATWDYSKKINIDNSKPTVSVATNPANPDGNNGIYKTQGMSVTLSAAATDKIYTSLNWSVPTTYTKVFTPTMPGTYTILYYAEDLAGNRSDTKVFIFEYDSVKPGNVSVNPVGDLVNSQVIAITGSVANEGGQTGSRVLLKKGDEIVGQAVITSADAFVLDSVRLAEGNNIFGLIAIDRAGNQSAAMTTVSVRLDSTAPKVMVEKSSENELIYNVTVNETVGNVSAKFNGAAIAADKIIKTGNTCTVEVPGMLEGINTLNITVFDTAGNIGTGSFTSTYIPANTAQTNVPLNDNATMDIPADAFTGTSNIQMIVRTVDVLGNENYKPLGASISFEFSDNGVKVDPEEPLVIRNFIGTGLTGVVLMHIGDNGSVGAPVNATITTSETFNEATMERFDVGVGHAYYITDTGYLVFKTKEFSAYQIAQDDTPPVITVTTTDYNINKADADAGKLIIEGTLTDSDPNVHISEVRINGVAMDLSGIDDSDLDESFSIPLNLTNGTHEVIVKAVDAAGHISSATRTYNVDITVPALSEVAASAAATNRDTVDLTFRISENADVKINEVSIGNFNGRNTIALTLAQGSNVFSIKATDAMGNESGIQTVTVTRDSTAPVINVTGISDGDIVGGPISITVGIDEEHAGTSSITLDGASEVSPINNYNVQGTHTLVINATDSYGNTSARTITFTIDNSAPVINIAGAVHNGVYGADTTLTITASNADNLKVTKAVNGGSAQEEANITAEPLTTDIELDLVANAYTTYTVRATAQMTIGGQVRNAVRTIVVAIDDKAPVITSTTIAQTETATINITGSIDEVAVLYLNDVLVVNNHPTGAFTFAGNALVLGNNTFVVKAVDIFGNVSTRTITVNRVAPQQNGGDNGGGGGIIFIPFIPGQEQEVTVLEPIGHKNSGMLPEVKDPLTGTAKDSAENTAIGANGGTVATKDGAFKLEIPENTVDDQKNTFRIVVFELDPKSPLSLDEQISSGSIKLVSKVVDFSTDAEEMQKPVKASFKYDAKSVTDPTNLRVFYWNVRTNAWVPVAMADTVVDAKNGIVEATLYHFTRYAVMEVNSTLKYADVQSQWHATYVERASQIGIINGFLTNGVREFRPNASLTRAEFVTMLARVLKLDTASKDVSAFKDASSIADWAKGYIKAAYDKGIISPYADGTFKPSQSITRAEMAVMLVNAMGLKPAGNASAFKDQKDIPANVRPYVTTASELNIIVGKGDGKFYPADSLTRAEAAKVIVEMIEVLGKL